jgi:hypothetical protein
MGMRNIKRAVAHKAYERFSLSWRTEKIKMGEEGLKAMKCPSFGAWMGFLKGSGASPSDSSKDVSLHEMGAALASIDPWAEDTSPVEETTRVIPMVKDDQDA